MNPGDSTRPTVRSLLTDWLSVTGWVVQACAARTRELVDDAADSARYGVMDFDLGAGETKADIAPGQPLPPVCPEQLTAALRKELAGVLHQAAAVINDDPAGCCTAMTEERVLALFRDLGQHVLAVAQEQRVARAEAGLPAARVPAGEWARKWRRMLAGEGRWPAGS